MKKKVIISANVIFTIANFRKNLIEFLLNQNYEVICVANNDDLLDTSFSILSELNVKFIKVNMSRKGVNPIEDFIYLIKLVKIYKQEKPDLIMHFTIKPNIYGTLASRIAGVPSINTINGLGSAIIDGGILSEVLKLLYKFSLTFSSKVFFQNEDDKSFFINSKLVNKEKVAIVPGSGVDTEYFSNCKSETEKFTFLLVARLLKDKGIYEYIDAVKRLRSKYENVQFLLAGPFDNGNPSAIGVNEVKSWEEQNIIQYLGKTNNIKEFLSKTDVVVLPSYREGLSRFLIESASASKPIVTTNIAGCKDVVDNKVNGFLCKVKDSYSLQKAMEKMVLLNKEDLTQMGKNSKKIAKKKFDKDIVNQIYFEEIQ